ncbi:MAG: DUF3256 family protein [Bacteroidales bacterium]|nr:DUF3256 family protein [Bacteroidales bacterium]
MKKFLFLLIVNWCVATATVLSQPLLMRDVFAAMPDSVLPMVSKNNRLDCIDFKENNMEARVRNLLDEYVSLEALTADYARFRTSAASLLEMKLLPTSDSTSVLCVVFTAQMGEEGTALRMEDSHLAFYTTDWEPLPEQSEAFRQAFDRLGVNAFLATEESVPSPYCVDALRSLNSFHPVGMAFSSDDATLTLSLQTAQLSKEEREAVRTYLRPVVLQWNGQAFVAASSMS